MADNPTSRYLARKQSLGSNASTWGDTKLNDALDTFDRGSKGYEAVAMTGDTTLSWSNYTKTNSGQVSILKLTGSLSAAANLVVPSYEWNWDAIINATGQTVTVKTATGTGVAIPTGRQIPVYCDASDCYFGGQNYIGSDITLTNSRDLVDKGDLETALATIVVPAAAGTVLNSAADTTAGYLGQKLTTQISGVTTTQLSGLLTLQFSTINAGGNEQLALVRSAPYVGGYINDGVQTSQYTPVVGHSAVIDTTSGPFTINLTGMTTPQTEQSFKLTCVGGIDPYFLGTLNGTSNSTASVSGPKEFVYVGGTTGWSCSVSSAMGVNFTDPYKFLPVSAITGSVKTWTSLTVTAGNNELVADNTATFQQTIAGIGAKVTTTFAANVYSTVLNITSTTAGEVASIYGPVQKTTGAQIIRITRDGGTPKTFTISVTAGYRACLLTGVINSGATTPANLAQSQLGVNSARSVLDIASAVSASKMLADIQTAKYYGTPLFEFSRSLLVEIQSTSTVMSTTNQESSAGVVYRTLMAG